jgi:hypothetical protein
MVVESCRHSGERVSAKMLSLQCSSKSLFKVNVFELGELCVRREKMHRRKCRLEKA